jgi:hypothetical protein
MDIRDWRTVGGIVKTKIKTRGTKMPSFVKTKDGIFSSSFFV